MLAGLALLACKEFTVESSDKVSVYQSAFCPSEFTFHLDEQDIMNAKCKFDSLDITDPCHASGVLFTTIMTADMENVPDLQYQCH